eukprot:TRINITY_DN44552_c0_g1_i1.p1 TRINITY_DN44552_c0_g1~~TRINITY_DN44552_c0_g1_i1.p1  ORF type:complete len:430 (-),score=25.00 TRINITY_DN44552_c0_g1_i1:127-1416(-)
MMMFSWLEGLAVFGRGSLIFLFALHCVCTVLFLVPINVPVKRLVIANVARSRLPIKAMTFLLCYCSSLCVLSFWRGEEVEELLSAFGVLSCAVSRQLCYLSYRNEKAIYEVELLAASRDILEWKPPPVDAFGSLLAPYRWLLSPRYVGLDRIPRNETPLLFVSNHALWGLEMPLLLEGIYRELGIYLRPLGDRAHFYLPGHRHLMELFGVVEGSKANFRLLMQHHKRVLVYPGGAREVWKNKLTRKYELLWENRLGFARLAIEAGCTIVPCCSVGTEDMLHIMQDIPLEWLVGRSGMTLPLVSLPSPAATQRVYFWFGDSISTEGYKQTIEAKVDEDDDLGGTLYQQQLNNLATNLRDKVKTAVEAGIDNLKAVQAEDEERLLPDRLKRKAGEIKSALANQLEKALKTFSSTETSPCNSQCSSSSKKKS